MKLINALQDSTGKFAMYIFRRVSLVRQHGKKDFDFATSKKVLDNESWNEAQKRFKGTSFSFAGCGEPSLGDGSLAIADKVTLESRVIETPRTL